MSTPGHSKRVTRACAEIGFPRACLDFRGGPEPVETPVPSLSSWERPKAPPRMRAYLHEFQNSLWAHAFAFSRGGADVNAKNDSGETAFSYTCANDSFQSAKLLQGRIKGVGSVCNSKTPDPRPLLPFLLPFKHYKFPPEAANKPLSETEAS
jgi:hypothetical protein